MTIKANGRSALILATGFFVCFAAGPSQAAADTENATASSENAAGAPSAPNQNAKHGSRHSKTHAHHKSSNVAEKVSTGKKADGAADDGDNSFPSSAIPPSVANANAQLASADTPTSKAAKAMSARANEVLQAAAENPPDAQPAADTQVVAADQVNDVDRALHESKPPAPMMAMASAEAPAAPVAPVMAAGKGESSTWEQTSLIGKIFIGFGALLTMASAARMFMA
jgi:hypothetical protein